MTTRHISQITIEILDSDGCPIPLRDGLRTRLLALRFDSMGLAKGTPLSISIVTDAGDGAIAVVDRGAIDFIRARRDDDPLTSFLLAGLSDYGRDNDTGSIIFGDGEEIITVTLNPEPCPDTEGKDAFGTEILARHPKAGRSIHAAIA